MSGGDVQRVPAWGHVVATWLPRFVLLAAVWCLVAMVLTPFSSTVAHVGSALFGIFNIPVAGNVFTAALLFVVGSALAVRKRAALWFVLVVFQVGWLVVASFVTVLRAWDVRALPDVHVDNRAEDVVFVLSVAMAFVMIVVLWRIRPLFPARLAPGSWKRALIALVTGVGISAGVGILLTEAFPNSLSGQRRKILWPIRTAIGLEPDTDSTAYRGTGTPWVAGVIGALSTIALLWAFAVLLRSARPVATSTRTTRWLCGACCATTARPTRSATSPPAGTRWSCSRPMDGRPSPTASRPAPAWPAPIRSAIPGRGRRPSRPGCPRRASTAGHSPPSGPASAAPAPTGASGCASSASATRP